MKSKMTAVSITLLLLFIVLVGCSSKEDETATTGSPANSAPAADAGTVDQLVITGFNWGWDIPDPAQDKVLPELTKRLNLKKLDYNIIKTGSYDEVLQKMQLWASTGGKDWPDFLTMGADDKTKLILDNLGESGKLADLTPWLEKYPNVKKAIEKLLPFSKNAHDGKIYYIPQNFSDLSYYPNDQPMVWIRKDWLDQLKLPYPKTIDEFYNTLVKFKTEIKEVNGQPIVPYMAFGESFMSLLAGNGVSPMSPFFPNGQTGWYTDADGNAAKATIAEPDNLVKALTFYNKLYKENLLDKESFSLKQGQIDEKGNQGRIGALHGAYWQMANPYTDAMQKTDPNSMFVGIQLNDPSVSAEAFKPKFQLVAWSMWSVKAGVPDAEVNTFFKTLDYVLSPEGTQLTKYGIEGENWQYNADGKVEDTKAESERTQGDWNKRAHEGIDIYTFIPNYAELGRITAPATYELRADNKLTWENMGSKVPVGYADDPQIFVAPGDVENKKSIGADDRFKQMVTNAVTASSEAKIKDIVDSWVKTEKAQGYDDIVKERTASGKKIDVSLFK